MGPYTITGFSGDADADLEVTRIHGYSKERDISGHKTTIYDSFHQKCSKLGTVTIQGLKNKGRELKLKKIFFAFSGFLKNMRSNLPVHFFIDLIHLP
jgi:hypothetical protein